VSIKNDGHYFCRAGGNRPDGLNEPVTERKGIPALVVKEALPGHRGQKVKQEHVARQDHRDQKVKQVNAVRQVHRD
nr:hypothetical protein [Escherichia coli]